MKTAISLPDSLVSKADALAKRARTSRNDLFRTAISEYLEAHKHDRVREALDAVYAEESSQLDESIMRMQVLSLPKEEI